MVHSAHYDQEGVKQRLLLIDQKCEDFMMRLDNRRKNLTLAINFFSLANTVGHATFVQANCLLVCVQCGCLRNVDSSLKISKYFPLSKESLPLIQDGVLDIGTKEKTYLAVSLTIDLTSAVTGSNEVR